MHSFSSSARLKSVWRGLVPCLITGTLLLLVYAVFGFAPFGEKSISWGDMDQQVIPLLAEFRRTLLGEGSFFRSPGAGSISYWGIYFFFLSSPFSFLSVFCQPQDLPWMMNWLLLWKMMVCAGTSAFLFRKLGGKQTSFPCALLGVLYAFSGYAMLYYQNIVWLDMMALFPLLLLALKAIGEKHTALPFTVVFSLMLIVNYYLCYMVVLFILFIYSLYLLLLKPAAERRKCAALLSCGAAISVLVTAAVWLPSLIQVLQSARGEGSASGITSDSFWCPLATTLPTVLTAGAPFAAIFFSDRHALRSKGSLLWGLSILVFLIPLFIHPINSMWHTGSYQAFPTRYGYMVNMLLLLTVLWFLRRQTRLPEHSLSGGTAAAWGACGGYLLLSGLLLLFCQKNLSAYVRTLWGSDQALLLLFFVLVASASAYVIIFSTWQKRLLSRRMMTAVLAVMVAGECFFNGGVYIGSVSNSQDDYVQAVELLENLPQDDDFYRVKTREKSFDVNLFSAMGVESLSHYTSLTPQTTLVTQRRLGYSGYWMEVNSNGGTAFTDALLGNRYEVVEKDSLTPQDTVLWSGEELALTKVPYTLPDAILTKTEPGFLEDLPEGSRMEIQKELAQALFPGSDGIFTLYKEDTSASLTASNRRLATPGLYRWNIQVDEPSLLYFDCASEPDNSLVSPVNSSCSISVNGVPVKNSYPSKYDNGILFLGEFSHETVEVTVTVSRTIRPESMEVFGIDKMGLENLCENARGAELTGSGSRFTISCTAEEGETLFIPLSWSTGWKATVNGQEVPVSRAAGNYLSIPTQAGENEIVLTFTPPGLPLGVWISAGGLVLGILFFWLGQKRLRKRPGLCTAISCVYSGVAIAAAALVYLVPVAIWILAKIG